MWKSESSGPAPHAFLEQNAYSDGRLWRYTGIVSPFAFAGSGGEEAMHDALPRSIAIGGLSICQYVGALLSTWRCVDDKGSEQKVFLLLHFKI
jgi:hypothetical protein